MLSIAPVHNVQRASLATPLSLALVASGINNNNIVYINNNKIVYINYNNNNIK